ncbi:hypothetical protein [Streptomyces sp. TRM68367]|uniref:hypothetical protein n=1 Tax=Streptomyces sp. TRM68367 TaxID=2758415 RepID=UPI00165C7F07|nr:hypothetical protein [Streptomyces sp. TRM68367]MBC9725056.1 hypothetical protein [Streptomyces sp. TRM68367]
MDTPLFSASALLIALATAAYLIYAPHPPRREPSPMARRARLVLCAGAFASAFLLVPPVAAAVDDITGHGGAGALLFALTSGLTILSMQLVTVSWWQPTIGVRRAVVAHIVFFGCVMALLVWEFQYIRASSAELFSAPHGDEAAAAFMLTHLGFLDVMAIAVSLQYTLLACAAWPRWPVTAAGLAVTAVGSVLGLAYSSARTGLTIAHLAGWAWPSVVETHIVPITGALAALFVTVGITLPTVAKRVLLPRGRSATRRAVKDSAVRRMALP